MDNDDVKIFILTRTSGRKHFFHECFDSVITQSYQNICQLVSYDDPDSGNYVKKYHDIVGFSNEGSSSRFRSFQVSKVKREGGSHFPFNLYLNHLMDQIDSRSNGWIMFLDDDDVLADENSIQIIVNNIKNHIRRNGRRVNGSGGDIKNKMLLWRVKFPPDRLVPRRVGGNRVPRIGDVSMIGFAFHVSWKDQIRFSDRKGGDHQFIRTLWNDLGLEPIWIDEVLSKVNYENVRRIGSGLRNDLKFSNLKNVQNTEYKKYWDIKLSMVNKPLISFKKKSDDDISPPTDVATTSSHNATIKAPRTPKTPKAPKEPKAPKAPKDPKVPKTSKTPKVVASVVEPVATKKLVFKKQPVVESNSLVLDDGGDDDISGSNDSVHDRNALDDVRMDDDLNELMEDDQMDQQIHNVIDNGSHSSDDNDEGLDDFHPHDEDDEDDEDQVDEVNDDEDIDDKVVIQFQKNKQVEPEPRKLIIKEEDELIEDEENIDEDGDGDEEMDDPEDMVIHPTIEKLCDLLSTDGKVNVMAIRDFQTEIKSYIRDAVREAFSEMSGGKINVGAGTGGIGSGSGGVSGRSTVTPTKAVLGAKPSVGTRPGTSSGSSVAKSSATVMPKSKMNIRERRALRIKQLKEEKLAKRSARIAKSRGSGGGMIGGGSRGGDTRSMNDDDMSMLSQVSQSSVIGSGGRIGFGGMTAKKSLKTQLSELMSGDASDLDEEMEHDEDAKLSNLLTNYAKDDSDGEDEGTSKKMTFDQIDSFLDRVYIMNFEGHAAELQGKLQEHGFTDVQVVEPNKRKDFLINVFDLVKANAKKGYKKIAIFRDFVHLNKNFAGEFMHQLGLIQQKKDWKMIALGASQNLLGETGGFDWKFYLQSYPDLVKSNIKDENGANKHWKVYGLREKRFGLRTLANPESFTGVCGLIVNERMYADLSKLQKARDPREFILKNYKSNVYACSPLLCLPGMNRMIKMRNRHNLDFYDV